VIGQLAATLPPDELTWTLLGVYQATDSYEEWCLDLGLDPKTDEAIEMYTAVHVGYADIWRDLGSDEFFARLATYEARWKALRRGSERAGNRSLVARLRGRLA